MAEYKKVKIERGPGGWGGPLEVKPSDEKNMLFALPVEEYIQWHKKLLI